MDWEVAGILLLAGLVLWAYIPRPVRQALRGGVGTAVPVLAGAVRAVARPVWRAFSGAMHRLYGVEPLPAPPPSVNRFAAPEPDDDAPEPFPAEPFPAVPDRVPPLGNGENLTPRQIAELLSVLTDGELQAALALTRTDDGEWRFAESRVAKFMPGRVEDRQAEVREVRGLAPKPDPERRRIVVNGREQIAID